MSDWDKRSYGSDGYNALRAQLAMELDGYDLWGTAMDWFFGIADVLWHNDYAIPMEWEYRHGCGCDAENTYPDELIRSGFEAGHWSGDDLLTLGRVLDRYTTWLRLAGKDY